MLKFFGIEFKRAKDENKSFAPPIYDDGAITVASGGVYGTYVDIESNIKNESDLVTRYRQLAYQPEIERAINEICNESIVVEENKNIIEIILDDIPMDNNIKKIIVSEFKNILDILNFNNSAYDYFKRWYIDGRQYFHVIIDPKNIQNGIQELRYIDPRKIRKIREIENIKDPQSGIIIKQVKEEYYVYNENGFASSGRTELQTQQEGIKIQKDSIILGTSGLMDIRDQMVLSYLHSAMRPMNQLRSIEDSTLLYHLARAPERRVFYVDTGSMPHTRAKQYMEELVNAYRTKLSYNAATGEVKDSSKTMCYSLDTKIPLLDGRTLELDEIIKEYKEGKQNWVYSCDPITGKFVPGPISWAGVTKKNAQVVKITFDNGKSVICTPDHKFPVWNKGFVEAKDLVGESIIPGYRRMQKMYNSGNEYEQIYKNDTKTWEYTHREVAKWKDENNLREEMIYNDYFTTKKKNTIHHRDFNRFNNNPNNLIRMNRNDHLSYHMNCAQFLVKRKNRSEDFTPEWRYKLSEAAKKRKPKCKTWKIKTPTGEIEIIENLNQYCRDNNLNRSNIKGVFGSKKYFAEQLYNHKAISVEWLDERIDVGCITIDLEETYHSHHTYLLDAGVYTKNSMLEDYWLQVREGGRGTKIEPLSGGTQLSQLLETVQLFEDKLYRSLHVPISRLKPETLYSIGRASQISIDEINFSKFIDRLRNKFCIMFLDMLEKQLVLKKIIIPDEYLMIRNKIKFKFLKDNVFSELKDNEIMSERLNILNNIMPFIGKIYSWNSVRKNICKQTEEDIEEEDAFIAMEMRNSQYMPPEEEIKGE